MAIVGNLGRMLFQASSGKIVTYQRANRTKSARFAEHDILDAQGRLQWTGQKLASMSMSIKLDASWCEVQDEIDKLEDMLDKHRPVYLVLGTRNLGKVVIESYRETIKRTDGQGKPILVNINLRLKEYN